MKRRFLNANRALMLAVAGMLTISHALAAKPAWVDDGRDGKSGNSGQKEQV